MRLYTNASFWLGGRILENHMKNLVSVDFFAAPTLRFQVLCVFLVLAHDRRRILHFGVPLQNGPSNNSAQPFLGTRRHAIFYGIATASSATPSASTSSYGNPGSAIGAAVTLATRLR